MIIRSLTWKSFPKKLLILSLSGCFWLVSGVTQQALALQRARITEARNAQLLRPGSSAWTRARAGASSFLLPQHRLMTGSNTESYAQLRFSDQDVVVRQGYSTTSWFLSERRCRILMTVGRILPMIRSGTGGCVVETPEGRVIARGTAFFVWHDPTQNTTVVGVLTNSDVEVSGRRSDRTETLQAGQVATIVDGAIASVEFFDLQQFYRTSDLAVGLGPGQEDRVAEEPADVREVIEVVREETVAAVEEQGQATNQPDVSQPTVCVPNPQDTDGVGRTTCFN